MSGSGVCGARAEESGGRRGWLVRGDGWADGMAVNSIVVNVCKKSLMCNPVDTSAMAIHMRAVGGATGNCVAKVLVVGDVILVENEVIGETQ